MGTGSLTLIGLTPAPFGIQELKNALSNSDHTALSNSDRTQKTETLYTHAHARIHTCSIEGHCLFTRTSSLTTTNSTMGYEMLSRLE